MKVSAKLFGTINAYVPGCSHLEAIEVEIPDSGRVKDLLVALRIPRELGAVIVAEGRILTLEDMLYEGASVNILSLTSGG